MIGRFRLRFASALVDKQYAALVHLFDSIFDPEINPGIQDYHYLDRTLRLGMLHQFDRCLEPGTVTRFWSIGKDASGARFSDVMKEIERKVLSASAEGNEWLGVREAGLMLDAIIFAKENSHLFLHKRRSNLDAPNTVAFSLVIQCALRFGGIVIDKVIHDVQDEFSKSIEQTYHAMRFSMFFGHGSLPPNLADEICFADSTTVPELQLADLFAWYLRRLSRNDAPELPWMLRLERAMAGAIQHAAWSRSALHQELNEQLRIARMQPLPDALTQ